MSERRVYRRCLETDCYRRATHGLVDKHPLTCRVHKLDSYRDVVDMWCVSPGCTRKARYGLLATRRKTHCYLHRFNHHVNLSVIVYCEHYIRTGKTVERCPNIASRTYNKRATCLRHRWSTDSRDTESRTTSQQSKSTHVHKFSLSQVKQLSIAKFMLLSSIADECVDKLAAVTKTQPSGPHESITSHEQDFLELHAHLDVSQEEIWDFIQ